MRHAVVSLALLIPAPLAAEGFDVFACAFDESEVDPSIIVFSFHDDGEGNVRDLEVLSASVTVDPQGGYTSVRDSTVIRISGGAVRALTDDVLVTGTCSDISFAVERIVMAARMTDVGGGETLMEQELRALLDAVRRNEESATARADGFYLDLQRERALLRADTELDRRSDETFFDAVAGAVKDLGLTPEERAAFFLAVARRAGEDGQFVWPDVLTKLEQAATAAGAVPAP